MAESDDSSRSFFSSCDADVVALASSFFQFGSADVELAESRRGAINVLTGDGMAGVGSIQGKLVGVVI